MPNRPRKHAPENMQYCFKPAARKARRHTHLGKLQMGKLQMGKSQEWV